MEVENYSDLPQDRLLELLNQRDDELKTLRASSEETGSAAAAGDAAVLRAAVVHQERAIQGLSELVTDLYRTMQDAHVHARHVFYDGAVNEELKLLRQLARDCEAKVAQAQDELRAVKFNPDSKMGRQLVARCKRLQQENELLGKQLFEGKVQELQSEVGMQRTRVSELEQELGETEAIASSALDDAEQAEARQLKLEQEVAMLKRQLEQYRGAGDARRSPSRDGRREEQRVRERSYSRSRQDSRSRRSPDRRGGKDESRSSRRSRERERKDERSSRHHSRSRSRERDRERERERERERRHRKGEEADDRSRRR